ncbi:MAG: hypothetical protein ACE37H_16520 [Phycisphaeraceae bacterium]
MQRPSDKTNTDQAPASTPRLLELLSGPGDAGLGSAMLRLAQMAAAQHRAAVATQSARSWTGLTTIALSTKDKAEHGCPADTRSARLHGPVTTEGDR